MKRGGPLKRATALKATSALSRTSRLPPVSPKRRAEAPLRAEVRRQAIERDGGCVGPRRGLPGACGPVGDRTGIEVHEVAQRSTHPGSHLKVELTACLCPRHHDACSSPVGEMRELVESVGLLVRATT